MSIYIRTRADILALQSRIIGWAVHRVRAHTRAHAAVTLTLCYLDIAAALTGARRDHFLRCARDHFLRCARDQWRAAVRLTGGQS